MMNKMEPFDTTIIRTREEVAAMGSADCRFFKGIKIKVAEKPEIVVHGTVEKPYFEIKYHEVGKDDYNIGYSSYDIKNCFQWLEEEFEVVSKERLECFKNKQYGRYGRCWGCPIMVECGCGERSKEMIVGNGLAYKMFCAQNLEEVVRDHDNKGYINFAVDFDGVLCKSAYPTIGEPNMAMIHYLIEQRKKGNKVILWTARVDEDLQKAIDWCADYGLGFDHVNEGDPVTEEMYRTPGQKEPTRKVYADVYIDDRNMAPLNIWPVQYSEEEVAESELAFKSRMSEFDGKKISEMSSDDLYRICVNAMIKVERGQSRQYYLKKLLNTKMKPDIAATFASAIEGVDLVEDKVVHKAEHYQNGEFEVIDEMVIVFGVEAALQFCRLNAWKYRARAAYKGSAAEDMKKSDEYLKMAWELEKRRQRQCPPQSLDTKDLYVLIGDRK